MSLFPCLFAQACFTNGYVVLGSLLGSIPCSLRVFRYNGTADGPWELSLPFDFLCPLDEEGQPIIGSLQWPYLKTLEIEDVPSLASFW